jgi:hypothetical protein
VTTLAKLGHCAMSSWAAQRVLDGLARSLGLGDPLIELRELALGEPGHLLGEREPDVAQEQDDADEPDRRFGAAALP